LVYLFLKADALFALAKSEGILFIAVLILATLFLLKFVPYMQQMPITFLSVRSWR